MLIKTLALLVLTFAISTASFVNAIRDIVVVNAEASQVQKTYVITAEVAEVETVCVETTAESEHEVTEETTSKTEPEATKEATPTTAIEESVQEETITPEETFVDEIVVIEEAPVEETLETEETQEYVEETETVEEVLDVQTPTISYVDVEYLEETTAETQPEEIVGNKPYWEYYHKAPLEHNGEGYITDGPAGPNGNDGYETWYDLDMTLIVQWLDEYFAKKGLEDGCDYSHYEYWVDERGVKMYGPYIMVAGDIVNTRKRYDIVECSLGTAIVADYCEKAVFSRPYQLDIATDWDHRKRVN